MDTIPFSRLRPYNRIACVVFACALFSGTAPAALAQGASSGDLVGVWSGEDASGAIVSYAFDADATAAIYKNGEAELEGDETSRVTWTYRSGSPYGELDIVYSNDLGAAATIRYIVLWEPDGSIRLRSGGPSGARPVSEGPAGDPMTIRLSR